MANQEGNTPGRTPETRTRLAHFKTTQVDGTVHYGDESWPIVAGVVECPMEVAEGAGWPRASAEDIQAHARALTGPSDDEQRAELLKGSVADVEESIAGVASVDELGAIEAAEVAGKNRQGVLKAIAARLDALTKASKT